MLKFQISGIQMHFASSISGLRKIALAVAAGAGLTVASATHAAIVFSGPVNLNIPATTNGLYLNVVTGATNLPGGGMGTTVPGWDINLWSATGMSFFSPATPAGGAYVITFPNTVANLAFGVSIGPGSQFGSSNNSVGQWNLNSSDNYFGFRFINEVNGTLHYGWAQIAFGDSLTNRTLVSYAFESTPMTPIFFGTLPGPVTPPGAVPVPGTHALVGLGLAGLTLLARRRKPQT